MAKKRKAEPGPGWQGTREASAWQNPRPPAVPSQLNLDLREYFTAAALIGFLAAQKNEPNKQFACEWTAQMGDLMAAAAMRRRKKRS